MRTWERQKYDPGIVSGSKLIFGFVGFQFAADDDDDDPSQQVVYLFHDPRVPGSGDTERVGPFASLVVSHRVLQAWVYARYMS